MLQASKGVQEMHYITPPLLPSSSPSPSPPSLPQVGGLLKMTHVIIPKQSGTANSCDTQKEEEIFDALDREDLITLGWIHVSSPKLSPVS